MNKLPFKSAVINSHEITERQFVGLALINLFLPEWVRITELTAEDELNINQTMLLLNDLDITVTLEDVKE